jgi:hypothetical protein
MRSNILARNVRNKLLKSVSFAIKNQARLPTLQGDSAPFDAEKHSQLQRHVEPGQSIDAVEFRSGKIVDAESALFNDRKYLFNPRLAAIINLESAARTKSAQHNGKHNTIENWFEPRVEAAIDENPDIVVDRALIYLSTPHELL